MKEPQIAAPQLNFGTRYRITRADVIASQHNDQRTDLISQHDLPIPVGTVITVWDWMEWNPYSQALRKENLKPGFYQVELESPLTGFASKKLIVQGDVLERGVVEAE